MAGKERTLHVLSDGVWAVQGRQRVWAELCVPRQSWACRSACLSSGNKRIHLDHPTRDRP